MSKSKNRFGSGVVLFFKRASERRQLTPDLMDGLNHIFVVVSESCCCLYKGDCSTYVGREIHRLNNNNSDKRPSW